jgi:AraC-like DNA-binding protein/CRP-like cAMP-binding protein
MAYQSWPEAEEVPAGTALFGQGDLTSEVFSVSEGLIGLTRADAGRETTVGLRARGSLIGGLTGALSAAWRSSAVTLVPTRVRRMPTSGFRERLDTCGEFSRDALRAMKCEADADFYDSTRVLLATPERRLASLLASIAAGGHGPQSEASEIRLPAVLTARVWEDLLYVSPSALEEFFTDLESRGDMRRYADTVVFLRTSNASPSTRGDGLVSDHPRVRFDLGAARFGPAPAVADDRVADAIKCIDTHYPNAALNLHDISRHVHVSLWHLSRLFKRSTGVGFRQFLNGVRVDRARIELLTTSLTVKEIAAAVGYKQVSDLTRRFTAVYGISPSQYRAHAVARKNQQVASNS